MTSNFWKLTKEESTASVVKETNKINLKVYIVNSQINRDLKYHFNLEQ